MKNTALILLLAFMVSPLLGQHKRMPEIGIVQDLENDSLVAAQGYTCLVESVAKLMSPRRVKEQQFQANLGRMKSSKLPVYAFNIFLPGDLKVVGPSVDERAILAYADTVFRRCVLTGVRLIIWGSGGARRIPDNFDRKKAEDQFVSIARKLATLAKTYDITIALENLNSTETNFITTAREALAIVERVEESNFRLCVDIYHMLMEGEGPAVIAEAKKYIVHCDIAEREGRTPPGVHGDNFVPYLEALKKINYRGKIILECRWDNLSVQGISAYRALEQQLMRCY